MNVGIYARYSTEKQNEGYSIEAQLEACRKALPSDTHHIMEYVDRGRSGCTIAGRPELLRLLAEAEAGRIARCSCISTTAWGATKPRRPA